MTTRPTKLRSVEALEPRQLMAADLMALCVGDTGAAVGALEPAAVVARS